jgi:hypothetical protein
MSWKPLQFSAYAGTHLPPLLISATFADSYDIHLTDLTNIWSESLTKRAIIRRSQEESTSIDPRDGDQFKIFLDKLKLGLEGGKDTTLALTITADADRPSLILNITTNLPGGLAPLEWPVRLAAAPQSLLASQLTLPLLRAQHVRIQEIAALAEVLKEKDHVIQKLADKLEEQGTELGQVFPQAAGKLGRKVDRKRAEERVKGLGVFDMQTWRKELSHEESQDTAQLIGEVFTGENTDELQANSGVHLSEDQEVWWESIKGITMNLSSGKISTNGLQKAKAKPSPKPVLRQEDSIDDDAFQVQATPPHLATSSGPGPSKVIIDDSTDDEDDLDAPSQRSKIPDSFPSSQPPAAASSAKPKKFGTIGGKRAAPKPEPPTQVDDDQSTEEEASPPRKASPEKRTASPAPQITTVRPKKTLGKIGGKKEAPPPSPPEPEPDSETEPEVEASPPPVLSPPREVAKPKKGKLGQLGGKKKQAEPAPELAEPEASTSAAVPVTKRKLGQIGHGHKVERQESPKKPEEANTESRGRAFVKPEKTATPEPRETSLERADKKRERLRRELEEKAKAPVKKKRKF